MATTTADISTLNEPSNTLNGSVQYPTLEDVEAVILEYYGISHHDLMTKYQGGPLMEPRHMAFWLACTQTLNNRETIGKYFNRADGSTATRERRKIDARRLDDPRIARITQELVERLKKEIMIVSKPKHDTNC